MLHIRLLLHLNFIVQHKNFQKSLSRTSLWETVFIIKRIINFFQMSLPNVKVSFCKNLGEYRRYCQFVLAKIRIIFLISNVDEVHPFINFVENNVKIF